jgi:hypothetical protein
VSLACGIFKSSVLIIRLTASGVKGISHALLRILERNAIPSLRHENCYAYREQPDAEAVSALNRGDLDRYD